jgi:energy-converting hydrogenase Eha subunit H
LAAAAGTLVMSMQTPRYVMEGDVFNYASFAVTIAVTVWLGVLSVRRKDFFLATTFFLWTQLSMFLSSDVYYYVFFFANTIAMMVMFPLVKKELAADG